jgi:hypothetical protein
VYNCTVLGAARSVQVFTKLACFFIKGFFPANKLRLLVQGTKKPPPLLREAGVYRHPPRVLDGHSGIVSLLGSVANMLQLSTMQDLTGLCVHDLTPLVTIFVAGVDVDFDNTEDV